MFESVKTEEKGNRNSSDVLKEVYEKEIKEITSLYYEMIGLAAFKGHPYNPGAKFMSLIESEFKEKGIKEKPQSFLAYSYAIGNFEFENQLSFDTEDGLVFDAYKSFAEKTIQDLKS